MKSFWDYICEYYQDRRKWVSPEGLSGHEPEDPMYDDYDYRGYEEEEWEK